MRNPAKNKKASKTSCFHGFIWRRGRDSNPCGVAPKRFSRPPRYDRFDTSPYMKLTFDRNHQIFNCFRNSFRNALLCCCRSAEKVRCSKAFPDSCDRYARKFSRPPRYDHFDIPPYKRNYEIVLEKTLEEKTLLSEKCVCFPQIRGFFADCFRYGKEVSRLPCYDRRSLSTNTEISFRI